jgi:hypothetical protein
MAPGRSQVKRRNPAFFRGICAIVSRVLGIVFGFVLALFGSSSAAAFEDKLALGAGAGYAVWPGDDAAHGAALDLQTSIGLSEAWQLRAGGTFALHPHPSDDTALNTASARAELVYLVDIVDIVPFGGLGASGIVAFRDRDSQLEPAGHVVAGVAYWLSFDWLLELDARAYLLPGVDAHPLYFVSTLSVVVTFDR